MDETIYLILRYFYPLFKQFLPLQIQLTESLLPVIFNESIRKIGARKFYDNKEDLFMDWGIKNRLSRVIKPKTGKTVMLAVDHGYFLGPTTGLEDARKTIEPLLPLPTRSCPREAF